MTHSCDFCGARFPKSQLARVLDFHACGDCITEMARQSEEMLVAERLPG